MICILDYAYLIHRFMFNYLRRLSLSEALSFHFPYAGYRISSYICIRKKSPGGEFDKNKSKRRYIMWLASIIGALVGVVVTLIFQRLFASGTLRIDRTDPEKDVYRIDLNSLNNLHKKKCIVLKVDPYADLSQN